MDMPTLLTRIDWQSWIALAALLFSGYTFWKQHRLEKEQAVQQKQLNDLMIAKELAEVQNAKKAELSASYVKELKGSKVKVFNKGQAVARNVRLVVEDEGDAFQLMDLGIFPLEAMEPQQGVSLIAAVHMGSPPKMAVTLIWDDDTGADHRKMVYLTR